MKKFLVIVCFLLACIVGVETWWLLHPNTSIIKPVPPPKPLLIYTFENLRKTKIPATQITLGRKLTSSANTFSQIFYFETPDKPGSMVMKKVSGLMNAPVAPGNYPAIIMFRGFVPENIYAPGVGTEPVAQILATNGFITLSPDFLGYGESSKAAADSFENRFQTYTTALSMLASVKTLNDGLNASYSGILTADLSKIGIWGHSNGGHIALSTLAISSTQYPTVLWAPVSTSFPYSILYYTDESDDQGKILRKALSSFESIYNTDLFSPPLYYKWITSPIDIEQGTADVEVPYWWSENLVTKLTKNGLSITYNQHPGADHNMLPIVSWNNAVQNTVVFYKKEF